MSETKPSTKATRARAPSKAAKERAPTPTGLVPGLARYGAGLGLAAVLDPERAKRDDDDRRRGAQQRERETHVPVKEPMWLARAKHLYQQLGTCLTLLSHHEGLEDFEMSDEVRGYCEDYVRRFVGAMGRAEVETMELGLFLNTVDAACRRRKPFETSTMPAYEGVLTVTALILNREHGDRLFDRVEDLKALMDAWPHETSRGPGKPSKWDLAASVWGYAAKRPDLTAANVRKVWWKRKPAADQ